MKHSPGPWRAERDRFVDADGNPVAEARFNAWGPVVVHVPNDADARLIAAAPELLEALIGLVNCTNDPISAENLACSGPPCPMTDGDCVTCCARALLDRLSATEPPREP